MVRWVVGSILHGGPTELFLVPASAPRLVYYQGTAQGEPGGKVRVKLAVGLAVSALFIDYMERDVAPSSQCSTTGVLSRHCAGGTCWKSES